MNNTAKNYVDEHLHELAPEMKELLDVKSVSMIRTGIEDCAAFVCGDLMGIPWMMLPIGNADQNEHAPNENMILDCMSKGIKMGIGIIARMADVE